MEALQFSKTLIHSRQHVSPKRLGGSGPSEVQVQEILNAAGAAPDHGLTTPWHLYVLGVKKRSVLGDFFADNLQARDAAATEHEIEEARGKAFRAPLLILVSGRFSTENDKIPAQEKMISCGAAIQNMLLMTHSMGYGAGISSGQAFYFPRMQSLFSMPKHEIPLCFISIGTVMKHKDLRIRPSFAAYTTFED